MTSRERVFASFEGQPVDRFPVTCLYSLLVYEDHFEELTGEPQWKLPLWTQTTVEQYMTWYRCMFDQLPFELIQPVHSAPPREVRERFDFVEQDGTLFRRDKRTGEQRPLPRATRSGHARDYHACEERAVFDRRDVDQRVKIERADDLLARGVNDFIDATIREFGRERFIVSGGVEGVFFKCSWHVGLTNLFAMVVEEPALLRYLGDRLLEQNIEIIRRLASAGGDAVYIDDAMTTCDMLSTAQYEQVSLPYMKAMVDEIHRLGHKAIVIYFGGIADRLEQIASTGADGLLMEASMKGYVNDVERTVGAIGDRVTLFANIDPIAYLQNADDTELEREIRRQIEAGRRGRGFVLSPASPITPSTPVSRIRRFMELSTYRGGATY
ncbi:uroporphyrinogen decarboxylase family protein [Verrucomicrobiota bacterium]